MPQADLGGLVEKLEAVATQAQNSTARIEDLQADISSLDAKLELIQKHLPMQHENAEEAPPMQHNAA